MVQIEWLSQGKLWAACLASEGGCGWQEFAAWTCPEFSPPLFCHMTEHLL